MSKFHCPCGWAISDVTFPASEERHVISDADMDAITDYSRMTMDTEAFDDRQRNLLECSRCGRLHLQDAPGVNNYATFAREVPDAVAHVQELEAALAQLLWTYPSDPWHNEARATAEKLLKRNGVRGRRREATLFGSFATRAEAENLRDAIRGRDEYKGDSLRIKSPPGTVLTAHVVGPNRPGANPPSWTVAVGSRRK